MIEYRQMLQALKLVRTSPGYRYIPIETRTIVEAAIAKATGQQS